MRKLSAIALAGVLALSLSGTVLAGQLGTISVSFGSGGAVAAATTNSSGSIFTASGCGFKANSNDYAMVVYGPALYTTSYAYWVDSFPVGANGCGSSTVTWSGSGVPGDFQVWVARSPAGNFTTAQPASNIVGVTITNP